MARREWVAELARAIGLGNLDAGLLAAARRFAGSPLERLLELSFRADGGATGPVLRYAIETGGIAVPDRAPLVGAGFDDLLPALEYIGAEHAASGAIVRSKTYWGSALPLERILSVLPRDVCYLGEAANRTVLSLWPEWKTFRFVGIDFCASGPPRVKLYYPPRDCKSDLRMEILIQLCVALGIPAPTDQFAKLCYLFLDKNPVVPATAFILGVVLGAEPGLKLSIAPAAYRGGVRSAPSKAEALAVAFDLDPSTLQAGASALRKCCPRGNFPSLETLCAEFPAAGPPRVLTYYRLRIRPSQARCRARDTCA